MTELYPPNNREPVSLKSRLLKTIYEAYKNDDNATFRYASELFDEMFVGEDYNDSNESEYDGPEMVTSDIRIIKKIGKKAVNEEPEFSRYPLGERLTPKKGNILYCDKLKIGYRLDKDTSQRDDYSAHVHLFGEQCKDLHIVATVTDNDKYDPSDVDSEKHKVFLEPHGGSESDKNKAISIIEGMGVKKIRLTKAVAIRFAGQAASDRRRKPSKHSYQLI